MAALPMALGTLLGGLLTEKYGRRFTHVSTCLPTFAGWIIIYCARNVDMLLVGRFLTGLNAGILAPATGVYIGETSEPRYRGFLLGGISLAISVGLLLVHVLGTFLHWKTAASVCSTIPILGWLLMLPTPESPPWLAKKGCSAGAETSFRWLRGGSEESQRELDIMLTNQKNHVERNLTPKSFLVPEFLKPLGILTMLLVVSQWSGINAVNFYSVSLMKTAAGPGIDEYLATVFIDVVRVAASVVACLLIRKFDRRRLAVFGSLGTSIALFMLTAHIYLARFLRQSSSTLFFVPVVALALYISFVAVAYVALPWTLLGELLPLTNRSVGSAVASCAAFLAMFSVVKTMPGMFDLLGADGTFLVYGVIAFLGVGFVYLVLPETRGRTLSEIEVYFKGGATEYAESAA
ncbi:facilitated trehalose transporter Tret1-like isoform X2 [Cylas formicarius]|nr:facilitated trehalose transporter Tret1-like isoform X2 [Cylas formicarius]